MNGVQSPLRRWMRSLFTVYLGVGAFVAFIRLFSLFTWTAWHTVFGTPTMMISGKIVEMNVTGQFIIGAINIPFTALSWPLSAWLIFTKRSSIFQIFLFPWFQ